MKSIKFIFLSVAICIASVALVLQSCNNNENGLSDPTSSITLSTQYDYLNVPDIYKQVGQFHNEGMDSIFIAIQKALILNSKAAKVSNATLKAKASKSLDLNFVINDATMRYCKSNKMLNRSYEACLNALNNNSKKLSVKASNSTTNSDLSPIQKEYLNRISMVIKSEYKKKNFSEVKDKLTKINEDAEKKLNKNDAANIFIATSVAYASLQYWHNNIAKWYVLLKSDVISAKYGNTLSKNSRLKVKAYELPEVIVYGDAPWWMDVSNWWENYGHDIVMPDVEGAMGGAAVGWYAGVAITGGTLGTGVVTIPGAVIGGAASTALVASAVACFHEMHE